MKLSVEYGLPVKKMSKQMLEDIHWFEEQKSKHKIVN
jgi:hypothetical protein